ncbi:putative toxin-antitoxin system toxin component, PIN family [Pseudothauera nasutitermitis]|uniref:Putative toxin-antitoxin system toxin component, PIN family n=1 Tax=Pseudothauera nasutitermitis TaxID=2565930 RepID=A0A4S4AVI4_9RHOO|nr:putative toxin-antitoxin system toxin component, PIN family [Pseudothauera nasutitermitis]THF64039.1 putative toxin-antitoxin system toxin component, PIN family [Pseudothauera nasutitermitis]
MSSPRLVLDTNTVMALWLFEDPRLAALRAAAEQRRVGLVARADALEELRRVLAYAQFGVTPARQAELLTYYRDLSSAAPQPGMEPPSLPQCRDADDQKFLEIARDAQADALLTRDKLLLRLARHRLVRERFAILTPDAFIPPAS